MLAVIPQCERLLCGRRVDTYLEHSWNFFQERHKDTGLAVQCASCRGLSEEAIKIWNGGRVVWDSQCLRWNKVRASRGLAWVYKRMFQLNTRNRKYLLPSSHCFLWQGRIRAAHTGSLKHQQCRHDNFRKERKPQRSRGEIRGQAGVDSVCVHFSTLLGQLIRVELIYGCYIPVSSWVVYSNSEAPVNKHFHE